MLSPPSLSPEILKIYLLFYEWTLTLSAPNNSPFPPFSRDSEIAPTSLVKPLPLNYPWLLGSTVPPCVDNPSSTAGTTAPPSPDPPPFLPPELCKATKVFLLQHTSVQSVGYPGISLIPRTSRSHYSAHSLSPFTSKLKGNQGFSEPHWTLPHLAPHCGLTAKPPPEALSPVNSPYCSTLAPQTWRSPSGCTPWMKRNHPTSLRTKTQP